MTRWIHLGYKAARRVVVAVVGGTLVLIGVAMLVLPGPAMVVIPVGLAILGLEFAWARHWLRRLRDVAAEAGSRVTGNGRKGGGAADDDERPDRDDPDAAPAERPPRSEGGSGGC
jgi:tellurite resistance protein TerC